MLKLLVPECRQTFKAFNFRTDISSAKSLHGTHYRPFVQNVNNFIRNATNLSGRCVFNKNVNRHRLYHTKDNCDTKDKKAKNSNSSNETCVDKPLPWPSGKREKFMFHKEIEDSMNDQINAEFKAYYYYLSMSAYFGRVDVALPGCESFFMQMHHEEHEHALRFVNYVNMRGGQVRLCPISPPENEEWACPLNAFKTALQLEKEVTEKLVAVNTVAEKHGDLNASDFIITGFMEDQMKSVNEMAKLVTIISGIGDHSLARFMFDKDLLDNYVMSEFNILKKKNETNFNERKVLRKHKRESSP